MANERLIDGNALFAKFERIAKKSGVPHFHLDEIADEINEADAVEVVHGYWIDSYSADHMGRIVEHSIDCSVCENVFKDDSREVVKRWKERFNVCPFCGAKMDGGNEE